MTLTPEANFRAIAPAYMAKLIADFPVLNKLDAAAVFGNAGHESLGLTKLQEISPAAGRGGYGWFQWTGPRRVDFESYASRNKLNVTEPETNYKFLFVELKGPEQAAIPALRSKVTLNDKVIAFEESYERAGVKAYQERQRWAGIALAAYEEWSGAHTQGAQSPASPAVAAPATPAPAAPAPSPVATNWLAALVEAILALIPKKAKS